MLSLSLQPPTERPVMTSIFRCCPNVFSGRQVLTTIGVRHRNYKHNDLRVPSPLCALLADPQYFLLRYSAQHIYRNASVCGKARRRRKPRRVYTFRSKARIDPQGRKSASRRNCFSWTQSILLISRQRHRGEQLTAVKAATQASCIRVSTVQELACLFSLCGQHLLDQPAAFQLTPARNLHVEHDSTQHTKLKQSSDQATCSDLTAAPISNPSDHTCARCCTPFVMISTFHTLTMMSLSVGRRLKT